ncbi:MAG: hypothetical protein CM1200mP2_14540 [Planctomycetaceae bacterium]|nr:MAG: hypothetical protein CM1200mP2_14540 [Planctomycetaceae bacterium]
MESIGLDVPPVSSSTISRRLGRRSERLASDGHSTQLHAGRSGGGIAYNKDEFEAKVRRGWNSRRSTRSAQRVGDRVERVRDGGDAGRCRQRRDHLRDREPRPDGCSHRRLDHRCAGPDVDRKEYQRMRDATIACMREIGVETGGSNFQFAIDPKTSRMVIIEMNPRVSVRVPWRARRPVSRSPRSPQNSPSVMGSTRSPTTSPVKHPPVSSRPSTTW